MADSRIVARMTDVYDEADGAITIYRSSDPMDSIVLDPSPFIEGGKWNLIIENRQGSAYLMVWHESDYGNDPRLTVNLDSGEVQ